MSLSTFKTAVTRGRIVSTRNAIETLMGKACHDEVERSIHDMLDRYVGGDWGNVDAEDAETNTQALFYGGRVMGVYSVHGVDVWVITDSHWDVPDKERNGHPVTTTILLPEDY